MANNVDPDQRALYELSHLYLHCLQMYLHWSASMKWLTSRYIIIIIITIIIIIIITQQAHNVATMSIQRWFNRRWINVLSTLFQRCVPAGNKQTNKKQTSVRELTFGVISPLHNSKFLSKQPVVIQCLFWTLFKIKTKEAGGQLYIQIRCVTPKYAAC